MEDHPEVEPVQFRIGVMALFDAPDVFAFANAVTRRYLEIAGTVLVAVAAPKHRPLQTI
jgi:hypothetical protein